jgi:nitrite reductase/ring-hydroxylating ferredoxin subunit
MTEICAGRTADFDDDQRRIVSANGRDIVVFRHGDRFYALDNVCLHQGGPVGEGIIIGKVEAVLSEDKRFLGERFSDDEIHIVCPWHGWEYDIETGRCAGDRRRRLGRYETVQRGDDVYVIV